MVDVGSVPTVAEAVLVIGLVLLEAVILYLGYGVAEKLFGSAVIEQIKNA
jgi:hypothetical protein